ncbi:MAG: hypothetical protein K0S35_3440 [Geminicoccaceae bacterium]|jgi:hypothetical protein|nr:hypothetical protein [Geminicoccaceae bacterium]
MVSQGDASGEDEPPSVAQMVAAVCDALRSATGDRAPGVPSGCGAAPFDVDARLTRVSRRLDRIEAELARLETELATVKLLTACILLRNGRSAPAGNGARKLS